MVKHLIKKVSKSIQFTDTDLAALDVLAKELQLTRYQGGVETADVSKLVQRAVRYMIENKDKFKEWSVGGTKHGKKS